MLHARLGPLWPVILAVVVVALDTRVQQLHGGGDLLRAKHPGGGRQPLKSRALRVTVMISSCT